MLSPPESSQRKEHRRGSRAQAQQEAEKAGSWAVLCRLLSPSCSSPLPKSLLSKAFCCLFANHPPQIRAPLPILSLHTESHSCHLFSASYSLHLPSFAAQPNPEIAIARHSLGAAVPGSEHHLWQDLDQTWCQESPRHPPRGQAQLQLPLGPLPAWHMALCTRHTLGRKGEG